MKPLVIAAMCASLMSTATFAGLPRSEPEAQGVSSTAIADFVTSANRSANSLHSFMIVRHGKVIAEGWWNPYQAEAPHALYSLSKSFASTAVGLAIAEGKFTLDDPVLKFFPEDAPETPSANLRQMRVRDLLRMNTGHQTEPPRLNDQPAWRKEFLKHPVPFKPGTHFLYNTSATYMLAAIVEKTTGESLVDFLKPRLFDPLGITNPRWDKSPEGVTLGGYGLSIRTEDIAAFGQLYLQQGRWQGKQLIPEAWVQEATSFQTANGSNPNSDWDQGYGYQFWRCRHRAYRGDGAFGQYCIVMPDQDAVVAITSGLGDMQAVMNLVWDKLLPGIKNSALPTNPNAAEDLRKTIAHLSLPTPEATGSGTNIFGKLFKFPKNPREIESLTVEKGSDNTLILALRMQGSDLRIPCGQKEWRKSKAVWDWAEQPISASGAWTTSDTFAARICRYETPFVHTLAIQFCGDTVRLNHQVNVGFGPTKDPELTGAISN